ncbi:MAG: carboxypeptidase regulatory-like domain-containing protein, partial [Bacteroidota bacterium]
HDVYARDNKLYSSEIYVGNFTVYDVEDKQNIFPVGTQPTPFTFTHNTWLSDDGATIFTTDELANAPVAAYDISDLDEIVELDQYNPVPSLGSGVIPHNVHVWEDYLIISYYTDGGKVVDASNPSNLIEVGNFDTWLGGDGGFSGAWGADPFLPSGIVLVTDIQNGLYVLAPDYKRACWLEGNVTDGLSGGPLANVEVDILAGDPNMASSDLSGDYKTGQVTAGVFEVQFTRPGYITVIEEVTFENGVLVELDVVMQPVASVTGTVIQDTNGNPIEGAQVSIIGDIGTLEAVTNSEGVFQSAIEPGNYIVTAGAWGYLHGFIDIDLNGNETVTVELTQGYQDDFVFDLGWQTQATASSGDWELVDPVQSTFDGMISTPGNDISTDLGNQAYVTGNGGNGGSNDVDNGVVILRSPSMDLTQYNEPVLSYYTYFFNDGGNGGAPDDELVVKVTNGFETITLETIDASVEEWNDQSEFNIFGLINITDDMNIIFEASDLEGSGHIVEAAVDAFLVTEGNPDTVSSVQNLAVNVEAKAFPNPFVSSFEFQYDIDLSFNVAQLIVRSVTGQEIARRDLEAASGSFRLGESLPAGTYFLELQIDQQIVETLKAVKN